MDVRRAQEKRQEIYLRFKMLFERYDIFRRRQPLPRNPFQSARPSPISSTAENSRTDIDWIAPTFLITLVSLPAASAPAGLTRDGLPVVGIQIVAPRFERTHDIEACGSGFIAKGEWAGRRLASRYLTH